MSKTEKLTEELPPKPKKRGASREELLKLSKEELVDRLIQIEAHNFQLKSIINRNLSAGSEKEKNVNKNQKKFDFSKCHYRPILLHILYFGWDYQGFVVQEDTLQTIEHHVFEALKKTCLVESRESAKYHRCGRTDKGVSAYGQVISLHIRSKFSPDTQNEADSISNELPYCMLLNKLLPKEIRAVGWMPVPEGFSARFDCHKRQYKYYFPRSSLNIIAMKEACALLVGSHDFRNLCKMDVGNGVVSFVREVLTADVRAVDDDYDKPTSMYYLLIEGNAFLWHQIRCIQGILLLIGSGLESKDIISQLLDCDTNTRKPQYNMAIDVPLNLFKCSYKIEESTAWQYQKENLEKVIVHLQKEWTIHNIRATMIKDCIKDLEQKYQTVIEKQTENMQMQPECIQKYSIKAYHDGLIQGVKPKKYMPLMKRPTCSTLEEKIEHYKKRRKTHEPEGSTVIDKCVQINK